MPIPSSGPISMSMFNVELGRAFNTANSSLAGGTIPAVGSLFWLANQSGSLDQTAPHAMSEWYGYTALDQVFILGQASSFADGSGLIEVYFASCLNASAVDVDTNVTVNFTWTGDLSSTISNSVTITSGLDCGNFTFFGARPGENASNFQIDSISPASSATQAYIIGSVSTSTLPSCFLC